MPADPANPPSPEALRDYCRERLAGFKAPADWFFVAEYPLTASGKIQKFRLQEDIAGGSITPAALQASSSPPLPSPPA